MVDFRRVFRELSKLVSRVLARTSRPNKLPVGAATAARVVYPTVLAAWAFVALLGLIRIIFALTGVDELSDREIVFAGMVLLASMVALCTFLVSFRASGSYINKAREEAEAFVKARKEAKASVDSS